MLGSEPARHSVSPGLKTKARLRLNLNFLNRAASETNVSLPKRGSQGYTSQS